MSVTTIPSRRQRGRPLAADGPVHSEEAYLAAALRAFADLGYRGDGPVPALPDDVWTATSARYVDAYERLTGTAFVPGDYPIGARLQAALQKAGLL